MKAFNGLFNLQRSWELQRYRKDNGTASKILKSIPTVESKPGIVTRFKFSDAFFFHENLNACIRVVAMHSSCLLGHKNEDDVEIFRFNPDTNQVYGLAMESLLTDTFLDLSFYGSIFAANKQDSEDKSFSEKFYSSVDRSYMLLRHNSQFTGINLSDKMTVKIKWPQITDVEIATAMEERKRDQWMLEDENEDEMEAVPYDKDPTEYRKKSILYWLKWNLTKNLDLRYGVLINHEGGISNMLGSHPVMVKDLLRYHIWESLCREYEKFNNRWLLGNLLWENKVVFYVCMNFMDDTEFFGDEAMYDLSNAKELYTKCLIDVCDKKAGMSTAVVSTSCRPLTFVEGMLCFCKLAFQDRIGLICNKEALSTIRPKCYNHLVFDFNSHFMEVKRNELSNKDPKTSKDAREHDCIFYNAIYDSFRQTELLGLSDVFDYVVEINAFNSATYRQRWPGRPFIEYERYGDHYDSGCTVLGFQIEECFNLQDFPTVNHIHIIGGTDSATQEVLVWAAFGGVVAV